MAKIPTLKRKREQKTHRIQIYAKLLIANVVLFSFALKPPHGDLIN